MSGISHSPLSFRFSVLAKGSVDRSMRIGVLTSEARSVPAMS